MKSFSQELPEDRTFEIGGETFSWVYPFWEDVAEILDADLELVKEHELEKNGGPPSTKEAIARTQKRILLFLGKEDHPRFKKLTTRRDPAVPTHQFGQLYIWLLGVSGRRPTEPSSDLQPGDGNSEISSEEESS